MVNTGQEYQGVRFPKCRRSSMLQLSVREWGKSAAWPRSRTIGVSANPCMRSCRVFVCRSKNIGVL